MPTAPKTLCRCGGVVSGGVCSRCGPRRQREKRERRSRVYDTREWRDRTQPNFLRDNPWCIDCEANGLVTFATEAHHKVKAEDDPGLAHDTDNLLGLCKACHSKRTRAGE